MAIVIAATAHSHWQALIPLLEPVAGASADWERDAHWYAQAGAGLPDDTRVLILHCRPEEAIAQAMSEGLDPDEALQQWRDTTAAILAFYRRNRRRATLLEVRSAIRQPGKLAEHLAPYLEQPLEEGEGGAPAMEPPSLLMQAMAAQTVVQAPELSALISEAEASTLPLDEESWRPVSVDITALAAQLEGERRTQERQAKIQAQQIEAARQEIEVWQQRLLAAEAQANQQLTELTKARDHARHEAEALKTQVAGLKEQHQAEKDRSLAQQEALTAAQIEIEANKKALAAAQTQAKQQADELTKALAAARQETAAWQKKLSAAEADFTKQVAALKEQQKASERSLAETNEENELLLLQLHQVQEELESTFLKAQEEGKRLQQVEGERSRLQAEHQAEKDRSLAQQQGLTAAQKEIEANKNALAAAQTQAKQQADELNKALAAARQEISTWQKKLPAAEAQIKQQLADLTKARDAAASEAQATRQQLKALQEQHTRNEQKLADTTEENEFLLLQLHQLQGELETSFLHRQEESARLKAAEQTIETSNAEIAALRRKIQELEKSPFRRTLAPLQALAMPRGKRGADERKLKRDRALIQSSGLFHAEWYLQTYPDVANAGVDPLEHFLSHGAAEGRNPSTEFVTEYYLRTYPDVRDAAMNPLLHYIKFGREEGRLPKG